MLTACRQGTDIAETEEHLGAAIRRRAVPQLAAIVGAPTADEAEARERARMTPARGDGRGSAADHKHRRQTVAQRAVADLAGLIAAPAQQRARRAQRAGV